MFFSADDEDQDFLSSGGGSKLASLFGGGSKGGNESLTYTAPKQPKKSEPAGQSSAAPQLLFATAVQAYKYVDGKYANQGKLGAAVLGSHSSQSYRVLLYVTKNQQVTNATISPTFSYTVQPNNYGSFYDDQRQTWSLMFDSEANAVQFAKHVALSKANSAGGELSTLVSQDLQLGDGTAVDSGDMVEVKYTGWLLSSNTFGQEFDSNVKADKLFRFKIGSGKVIKAWDQGVVGMKKGSKRLLVVPPSLGYGSQGAGSRIPPNSTLIFEIEIVRVKVAKSSEPQSQSPAPVMDTSQTSTTPSPADELEDNQTVKGRTKSITEHMAQGGSSNKAKLISRMAKMGQPMLPMAGAVTAQPDSEEEVVMESPQPVVDTPAQPTHSTTNPIVTKPVPQHPRQPAMQPVVQPVQMMPQQPAFLQNIPAAQQLSVYQPQMLQQGMMPQGAQNGFQPTSTYQGQPQQVVGGMQQPMYTGMPLMNQAGDLPVLLTETRQQNTELRLSVGKMQDKMDQLLEKVDILHKKGPMALESSLPSMESSVLMHNIQRIVQENERLKKEGYDKNAKIERQNEKISELLQSNQMYVEKSQNLLEQRNEGFITTASQSQAKVLALEQEKVNLATRLSTVTAQLGETQLQLATIREKELSAQQKLGNSDQDAKKSQKEMQAMKLQHEEDEAKIAELSQDLKQEKQKRKDLDSKFSELHEEFTDIKSTNETLQKNLSDRKRKAAEEKRRMEDEFEETKINFEQEIQSLRDKLRKQKSSTDVVAAEQVSQVEEELTKEWKEKCDRLLSAANDKHNRALQALKEEKEEMEEKVAVLQNRIETMKKDNMSGDAKHRELEEQVEEMSVWKDKYDNLRSQATSMKEKYEERIEELENENEELETEKETAEGRIQALQREQANRPVASSEGSTAGAGDVTIEVKKIMNSVYQQLRSKFEADNSYPGDEVLTAILGVIKETTIKLVQQSSSSKQNEEEEDEEEEYDEEDSDDDDDDGDDEGSGEENQEKKEEIHETNTNEEEKPENVSPVTVNSDNLPDEKEETNTDPAEIEPSLQESQEEPQSTENTPPQSSLPPPEKIIENTPMGREPDKEDVKDQIPTENTPADREPDKEEPVKAAQNKYDDFEVPAIVSREPPPDVGDEDSTESEKMEENSDPLFGDDDNVADTFGDTIQTTKEDQDKKKKPEAKDLLEDDDSKQPPPPLFPDDDDDEDLDWLS
ncbi:FK506-binding protein 15-like isoform X2 [Ostrea edulis]|uniref:FK506-binding protein 15-like isoform X2 n=1 Tax=Ostrea edulis TaxID=37623 RepID=UPI002095B42D|nr:FK506-binding protein 15-like isoform X2 [Ostrea edulis]